MVSKASLASGSGVGVPGDHMCIMLYGGWVSVQNCKFLNCPAKPTLMTISDGTLVPLNGIEIAGNAGCHIWS